MRFVQFEINGPVCTITMNRPDKRNAVHRPMAEELRDAFLRFERDEALRVAVLTGSGGISVPALIWRQWPTPGCATSWISKAAEAAPWVRHGLN
jgi:hypothetical protein